MKFPAIYLASNSPRRRELLTQIEVDFTVISIDIDEQRFVDEPAIDYVKRVAIAKAEIAWNGLLNDDKKPVLAADTSVVIEGDVLGKPVDQDDARMMLQRLSGKTHQVMTAVAIKTSEQVLCELSINEVTFATLTRQDINWYLTTNEGIDKAGSYAVQGLAALFIDNIQGSYSAIMGLPLRQTGLLLKKLYRKG